MALHHGPDQRMGARSSVYLSFRELETSLTQPTPDLFTRLAQLSINSEIQISSAFGGQARRGWRVKVTMRGCPDSTPIIARGTSLVEALDQAITEADAMGWLHSPWRIREMGPPP